MGRSINWKVVAHATLHGTQMEILEGLAKQDRLSPVQFHGEGRGLGRVVYHFRTLRKAGLLEAAGTAQRRGTTEHFYRLAKRVTR